MTDDIHLALLRAASEGRAIGDDATKDMHVAGWLFELEPAERDRWLEVVTWVRRVDRLAEAALLDADDPGFRSFVKRWERLRDEGILDPDDELLSAVQRRWRGDPFAMHAFDRYVAATRRYHRRDLAIPTIAEFERMLEELSGSMLLCMPDVPTRFTGEVVALGAIDQLYNDVRDLLEDTASGLCKLPYELLSRFDGLPALLEHVVREIGPRMRTRCEVLRTQSIPPTWRRLVAEFDARHDLVEQTMVECNFQIRRFAVRYWERAAVKPARIRPRPRVVSQQATSALEAARSRVARRLLKVRP